MKTFWLSWNEHSDDYRPLRDPPGPEIIGWWCSGYAGDGSFSTLVAMVRAETEDAAWRAVKEDWPQKGFDVRFCNETELKKPGDRFPLKDWALERFESAVQASK